MSKRVVLVVLIFLLVTLTPAYILVSTVQQTICNSEYFIKQFDKIDMWTQMQNAMINLFSSQMKPATPGTQQILETETQPLDPFTAYYQRRKMEQEPPPTGALSPSQTEVQQQSPMAGLNITDEEISIEVKNTFTTDFIKAQASGLITNIFSYIKGEQPTLNLTISGVKAKLTTLMTNLLVNKTGLPRDVVESGAGANFSKSIPEPLDLDQMLFQGNAKDRLAPLKEGYRLSTLLMLAIQIVIALSIVLIFLITRDVKRFAKLVGWPIFISVLPLFIIACLGPSFLLNRLIAAPPPGAGAAPSQAQITEVTHTLSRFFEPAFSELFNRTTIVLFISIILIALTFVLEKKEKKESLLFKGLDYFFLRVVRLFRSLTNSLVK